MYDLRRKELLRLLETCFSHIMYLRSPSNPQSKSPTQGGSTSDREQVRNTPQLNWIGLFYFVPGILHP